MIEQLRWLAFLATGMIAGCAFQPSPEGSVAGGCAPGACPACPVCPAPPPALPRVNPLEPVDFSALTGWKDGEHAAAWNALLASCRALRWREAWRSVCARAMELRAPSDEEALLRGSRSRAAPYLYPLYGPPDDLLTIDLATVSPELRGLRLRGRVEGKRVVPYYSRAEIARGAAPVAGKEILWVDDPIEAFFLQVQGSGRVQLDSGETLRLGYADQNGHPFQSIGRHLV